MIVMNYADNGDLHKYLQNNFANITWNNKLETLESISYGYLFYNFFKHNYVY